MISRGIFVFKIIHLIYLNYLCFENIKKSFKKIKTGSHEI